MLYAINKVHYKRSVSVCHFPLLPILLLFVLLPSLPQLLLLCYAVIDFAPTVGVTAVALVAVVTSVTAVTETATSRQLHNNIKQNRFKKIASCKLKIRVRARQK